MKIILLLLLQCGSRTVGLRDRPGTGWFVLVCRAGWNVGMFREHAGGTESLHSHRQPDVVLHGCVDMVLREGTF